MLASPQSIRLKAEHRNDRDEYDWYAEPVKASTWLFNRQPFGGDIYDPCCGGGNVIEAARLAGMEAFGSDIRDRCDGKYGVSDFLSDNPDYITFPVDNIVSNPPYRDAERFIDLALERTKWKVAVLVRLAFLEGQARRKKFDQWPLAKVWVFSPRISMPPAGRGIVAKGGTVAYAWLVFDHESDIGKPSLGWLP